VSAACWLARSDDCCPFAPNSQPIGNISLLSRLFNEIKAIDPHHLTFGAIQCADAWMWTECVYPQYQLVTAATIYVSASALTVCVVDYLVWCVVCLMPAQLAAAAAFRLTFRARPLSNQQ
jgi:hypothetical protein